MALATLLIIVVVFVALIIFVPFLRSMLSGLFRFSFLIVVIFLAAAGSAILMNNETIFDRPGSKMRLVRFLMKIRRRPARRVSATLHARSTSTPKRSPKRRRREARAKLKKKKEVVAQAAAPQPSATPTPAPGAEEENLYDELMTRNYICEGDTPIAIPRAKLLEMVQQTISELKGWKLINIDPRNGVLNCVYTTRVFGFEDDIRIAVTPKSDIEICSQSKVGEPASGSLLGFFHGDFGANMGHIKQFYAALKEKTDQYCKELVEKQKPKGPNQ